MFAIIIFAKVTFAQDEMIKISDDLELRKISTNAYIHISYQDLQNYRHVPANGLIYFEKSKAFIIDTPWTNEQSRILVNWLRENLVLEIEGVIATHWHDDCMGGLNEIKKMGIKTYSHKLTREITQSNNLPVPQFDFQDSLTLKVNENKIICYYFGAGHTVDNIVVWIPEEKILFGGCMVKTLRQRNLGFTGDADVKEWPNTLKKLLKKFPESKIVIPGHGDYGDLSLIQHTIELLKE